MPYSWLCNKTMGHDVCDAVRRDSDGKAVGVKGDQLVMSNTRNCLTYIREWITRERADTNASETMWKPTAS